MQPTDLRFFKTLQTGACLREAAARAIDEANQQGSNDAQAAADLYALGTQLQAYAVVVDASAATNAAAPAVSSRAGAFAAKTITVTYDKAFAVGSTARAADFTITDRKSVV